MLLPPGSKKSGGHGFVSRILALMWGVAGASSSEERTVQGREHGKIVEGLGLRIANALSEGV